MLVSQGFELVSRLTFPCSCWNIAQRLITYTVLVEGSCYGC